MTLQSQEIWGQRGTLVTSFGARRIEDSVTKQTEPRLKQHSSESFKQASFVGCLVLNRLCDEPQRPDGNEMISFVVITENFMNPKLARS